jgi:ribosome biogenesis protein Tsr3
VQVVVVPMVEVEVTVDRITVKVLKNSRAFVSSFLLSIVDCAWMTIKSAEKNTTKISKRIIFYLCKLEIKVLKAIGNSEFL